MTFQTKEQRIRWALVPLLFLGLSACSPSETDGLDTSRSSPPVVSVGPSESISPPSSEMATGPAAPIVPTTPPAVSPPAFPLQPGSTPEATQQAPAAPAQPTAVEPSAAEPSVLEPSAGSGSESPELTPDPGDAPPAPSQDPVVVSWLPVGPIGPDDPAPGQRYLMLEHFQCDALTQSVQGAPDAAVWMAGAAVCKALQTGAQEDWQKASIAVARTPRVPQKQCLEYRVAATSALIVAQYRSNPSGSFKAEPAPGQACPRQLLGLTVVDQDLRAVPGMNRASGPTSGGTIVRLDGYYVRVGSVQFDGVPTVPNIVAGGGDYQPLYLRMPPAQARQSLRITITDTVEVAGAVTFFYDDPAASGSPPAPPAQVPKE